MAAARGDQVAETSSSRQPASPSPTPHAAQGPALPPHTSAPERPPDTDPQDSVESPSCSREGTGMPDNIGVEATADALTASTGSQASFNTGLQAGESAPAVSELTDPQGPSRQDDTEQDFTSPTTSEPGLHSSDADQDPLQCRNDGAIADQLETEPLGEPTCGRGSQGGGSVSGAQGGSQRPARTPLAAVQEAATPMLGSLSFKQAVHAKQGHGKLWCLCLAWYGVMSASELPEGLTHVYITMHQHVHIAIHHTCIHCIASYMNSLQCMVHSYIAMHHTCTHCNALAHEHAHPRSVTSIRTCPVQAE